MNKIVLNMSGNSNAVPSACTTRAIINTLKAGAIAAINVPIIEKISEVINNLPGREPLQKDARYRNQDPEGKQIPCCQPLCCRFVDSQTMN